MRALHVKNGFVVNVVEYPGELPSTEAGCDVVPAVSGLEIVGTAFDVTDALRDRRIDGMDLMIFRELFRLTNEIRTLRSQATISPAQYRAALRAQG